MIKKKKKYRILHLGPEDLATSLQRINAIKNLGHTTSIQYYSLMESNKSYKSNYKYSFNKILRYIFRKLGYPLELNNENKRLIKNVKAHDPDIIFFEKTVTIKKGTLKHIKNINNKIIFVFFSLDDMLNKDNQSKYYLESIPFYDLHVTTKDFNVDELYALGAKKVMLVPNAYDPSEHKPSTILRKNIYKSDVSFIGDYEVERALSLYYIAQRGIRVKVWGFNWGKLKLKHKNLIIYDYPLFKEDYRQAISFSKISLCFLRKVNRDKITTRSIEIPACKGFMLAERTKAHENLFQENVEAAYFSSKNELYEKIKYFLNNDKERLKISKSGYKKCIEICDTQSSTINKIIKFCENEFVI